MKPYHYKGMTEKKILKLKPGEIRNFDFCPIIVPLSKSKKYCPFHEDCKRWDKDRHKPCRPPRHGHSLNYYTIKHNKLGRPRGKVKP